MGYWKYVIVAGSRESEIPKDVNMLCRVFPEGIADKAFPADSSARQQYSMPL